ncbi:hypothetical protein Dsin_022318 [Dipteronia sinensis]|uniref:Activator of Hsp90 ATPase homologue 1/2-like C-terminal domain-containing protein n=1 Tax=Dipteronia sinensis TaxID=43782 RepID=A0AAE0A1I6_9ROSI|nr:hypothetical protein Dsin_022318 [Dipteronia sinensis]
MDENRWKGFTQSNAKISKEVGEEFSIFDGSVTGKNLELEDGKLIVQKWRFGSWPDGIDSTVNLVLRLTFDEPEPGVTIVKLIHTDIPEEDRLENHENTIGSGRPDGFLWCPNLRKISSGQGDPMSVALSRGKNPSGHGDQMSGHGDQMSGHRDPMGFFLGTR